MECQQVHFRTWASSGRLEYLRLPGGKRMYSVDGVRSLLGQQPTGKQSQSNKEILKDKSKTCKKRTLSTVSSKTLRQGSTSNEKVCKPFWGTSSQAWSQKLWSCTETGLREL